MFIFVFFWLGLYVIWKGYPLAIQKVPRLFTLYGGLPRRGSGSGWWKNFGVFTYGGYYVSYETGRFNKLFLDYFHENSVFVQTFMIYWFNIGALVTVIGQLVIPFVLFFMLTKQLHEIAAKHNDPDNSSIGAHKDLITNALTTPIVPGINMSTAEMLLLWTCTVVVLAIHECGHALAAATAELEINGIGGFFSLIYPGAYVLLDDSVKYLPLRLQFRIYSGGIWHNLCCILITQVLLTHYSDILTAFTHNRMNDGAVVSYVQSTYTPPLLLSPILPASIASSMTTLARHTFATGSIFEGILHPGDAISAVNGVPVRKREDLYAYLLDMEGDLHHYNAHTLEHRHNAKQEHVTRRRLESHSSSHFNIGNPFTINNQTLDLIRLTHSNKESLQTCCRQHFQPNGVFSGLGGASNDPGHGECFVQERVGADLDSLFALNHRGDGPSLDGAPAAASHKGNLRRRSYPEGLTRRESSLSQQPAKRHFNYYCIPSAAIYRHGVIDWLPLKAGASDAKTSASDAKTSASDAKTSASDAKTSASHAKTSASHGGATAAAVTAADSVGSKVVLQPVTTAPLQVFMIDVKPAVSRHAQLSGISRRGAQGDRMAEEVIVVETTPHHFASSVGFVNYVPKPFFDAHSSPHKPTKHNYNQPQAQHVRTGVHGSEDLARQQQPRLAHLVEKEVVRVDVEEEEVVEEEADPIHSLNLYLYNALVFNTIIRWPELLYRIIYWSLQLHISAAIFNIIPLPYTDGKLICEGLCKLVVPGYWMVVSRTISYCCCVLVVLLLATTSFPVLFHFHRDRA